MTAFMTVVNNFQPSQDAPRLLVALMEMLDAIRKESSVKEKAPSPWAEKVCAYSTYLPAQLERRQSTIKPAIVHPLMFPAQVDPTLVSQLILLITEFPGLCPVHNSRLENSKARLRCKPCNSLVSSHFRSG
jgi:hypothetical protein